jgi:hypothetical protein
MKKLFYLFGCILLLCYSCTKDENVTVSPEETDATSKNFEDSGIVNEEMIQLGPQLENP